MGFYSFRLIHIQIQFSLMKSCMERKTPKSDFGAFLVDTQDDTQALSLALSLALALSLSGSYSVFRKIIFIGGY